MADIRAQQHPEDHTAQEWRAFWENSIKAVYLKQKAKAAASPSEPSREVYKDAERHDQPGKQQTIRLPTRTSALKKAERSRPRSRSPSYHPESPTTQKQAAASNGLTKRSFDGTADVSSDEGLFIRSPPKRRREAAEDVEEASLTSPTKRRRQTSEAIEIPSSSPPEPPKSKKRLPLDDRDGAFREIVSTPEHGSTRRLAREIPNTYPAENPDPAGMIDLRDDADLLKPLDEEDYQTDVARSPSPELGGSLSPPVTTRRIISETQAIFQRPTPTTNFELPPPEGGWDDEEDDQGDGAQKITRRKRATDDRRPGNSDEEDEGEEDQELPEEHSAIGEDEEDEENNANDAAIPDTKPSSSRNDRHTIQAILNAETQLPDFSLAEPEGGWDSLLPSSPPTSSRHSDPDIQSQVDQQLLFEYHSSPAKPKSPTPDYALQVDEFIDGHISQGYDEDSILVALKATNMDPGLSSRVLEAMRRDGERLP
ncbi:MAG: hypothetical protein Q9181_000878, partial [Wetmoreana brouardii]